MHHEGLLPAVASTGAEAALVCSSRALGFQRFTSGSSNPPTAASCPTQSRSLGSFQAPLLRRSLGGQAFPNAGTSPRLSAPPQLPAPWRDGVWPLNARSRGVSPTPLLASDCKGFSSFSERAPALLNRGKGGPDLHSSSRQGGTCQQADSSVPFSQALSFHSALLPSFVCVCVVSSLGLLVVLCHSPLPRAPE